MKNPELYHKTIGILVKAYQDDTLKRGDGCGCGVGNIVAHNMGIDRPLDSDSWRKAGTNPPHCSDSWTDVFVTCSTGFQSVSPTHYRGEARRQIDSTGYPWQDLAKIEYAFENAPYGNSYDESMFNGLMAVVDVLNEIHEVEKDTSKELFVKEVAQ